MEIKIDGYVIRPDGGSTWQVLKTSVNAKGKDSERGGFYPKSLERALVRVKEENLKDSEFSGSLDEAIERIRKADIEFLERLDLVLKQNNIK